AAQVGALLVVAFYGLAAELLLQQADDLVQGHNVLAVRVFLDEVAEGKRLPRHDEEEQFVLPRLLLVAGAVQVSANASDGAEDLAAFTLGGMKATSHVGLGRPRPRIAAVIATEHVGGEGTYLLSATTALGGFILPRVVVEEVFVGGGHQCLNCIGRCGLAGAVAAREKIDGAEVEFQLGNVAPVDEDSTLEIHQPSSSTSSCSPANSPPAMASASSSSLSSSFTSASGSPPISVLSTSSVTKLVIEG